MKFGWAALKTSQVFLETLLEQDIFIKSNDKADKCFLMNIYVEFIISVFGIVLNIFQSINKNKDNKLMNDLMRHMLGEDIVYVDSMLNRLSDAIYPEYKNDFTKQLKYLIIKRSDDIKERELLMGMSSEIAYVVFGNISNKIEKKLRIANIISAQNIKDIFNKYSMELNEKGVATICSLYITWENEFIKDMLK